MTLAQFSIACGAQPKWVQNAARILGITLAYTPEEAARLGLVKQIHEDLQMSLATASQVATEALAYGDAEQVTVGDGVLARVMIDLRRYRSNFLVRLAVARTQHEPRRRGRPQARAGRATARAQEYGWDIGLLRASLQKTPAERIRGLDENMEFARALRARR